MEIKPIAYFHSPLTEKFGIPRQSGVVPELEGYVELVPELRGSDALRGLEGFEYLWLIWGFDRNRDGAGSLTVRPPRLGGNRRIGVFASRSPYRPNPIGLSSVRTASVDQAAGIISVLGADLADGTPIYDIKPYVAYCDSHEGARSGFVDGSGWKELDVIFPEKLKEAFSPSEADALAGILSQDPRPHYQDEPERIYGLSFAGRNVKFSVDGGELRVLDITD